MKEYFKLIIFVSFSILITLAIYIVDVAFYRTPTFIQLFRLEREGAVIIVAVFMWLIIKEIHNKFLGSIGKNLICIGIGIFTLLVNLLTPPLLFSKYITLWDNNPLLAEFPVIWNAVSAISAISFVFILMFLLFCFKFLFLYQYERYTKHLINILIFFLFFCMIGFNVFENRYSFQPLFNNYFALYTRFRPVIFSLVGFTIIIAFRGSWINEINKKQKILSFCIGILILIISLYIFLSQYMVSVFAYSTSMKGFIIISLASIIIIITVFLIRLLFQLPQAAYFDRVELELKSFTNISEMIRAGRDFREVLDSIVDYARGILDANNCWIELINNEGKFKIVSYNNITDELVNQVESLTDTKLKEIVVDKQKDCIINDISRDEKTKHFRYIDFIGKSLLVVPLIIKNNIVGILYAGKKHTYAFKKRDLHRIQRYLLQIDNVWMFDVLGKEKTTKLFNNTVTSQIIRDKISIIKIENFDIGIICDCEDVLYEIIEDKNNSLVVLLSYRKSNKTSDFSEVRGVFKTLLSLETNPKLILNKFHNILKDNNNILELSVNIFNGKSKEFCVFSQNINTLLNFKEETILIDEKVVEKNSVSVFMKEAGIILNNYNYKVKSNLIDLFNVRDKISFRKIAQYLIDTPENYLMNDKPIDSIIIYRKQIN